MKHSCGKHHDQEAQETASRPPSRARLDLVFLFVMQLCVSTFNSRPVYCQQNPGGKVTRGETINSRKTVENNGFWAFF